MTIRALEALARTHTVMFDKTGTLTVGGARLIAVETAPGESADEVLRLAGSLEQASHHIVAAAIVEAALARGLAIEVPHDAREPWAPDSRAGSETARCASGRTSWSTAPASRNNGRCTCCGTPPGARH
jgi:cation transport ATPase